MTSGFSDDDDPCPAPGCKKKFPTSDSTLKHLRNEASGACHAWFMSRMSAPRTSPGSMSSSPNEGLARASGSSSTGSPDPRRHLDARLREILDDEPPGNPSGDAWVDVESDDESEADDQPYERRFPGASETFAKGSDILSSVAEADAFCEERKTNVYYPFSCKTEWEVARWLSGLNISLAQLEKFFKLDYVRLALLYLFQSF